VVMQVGPHHQHPTQWVVGDYRRRCHQGFCSRCSRFVDFCLRDDATSLACVVPTRARPPDRRLVLPIERQTSIQLFTLVTAGSTPGALLAAAISVRSSATSELSLAISQRCWCISLR